MTIPTLDHSTEPTQPTLPTTVNVLAVRRGVLVGLAIIGLLLGLLGWLFPIASLIFVAMVFGIYLIFSGIFRIIAALLTHNLRTGYRWLGGLLGILIVATGVIVLADPFGTLYVLAYVIGIGWIIEGLTDIMGAVQAGMRRGWLTLVSGILAIVAGIVIFALPGAGLVTFEIFASILLIVVSVSTLLTMPGKPKTPKLPKQSATPAAPATPSA
jgi:uncharacterized membrane protein HdeD (DUF308 family)